MVQTSKDALEPFAVETHCVATAATFASAEPFQREKTLMPSDYSERLMRFEAKIDAILSFLAVSVLAFPTPEPRQSRPLSVSWALSN